MLHTGKNPECFTFNSFSGNGSPLLAMSTRTGGVSDGPYRSLNLGLHVGDDDAAVLTNRLRFCRTLSLPLQSLVAGQQVHGTDVAVITSGERGRGAESQVEAIPGTDALITDSRDVALFVCVADCAAIALHDPVRHAIGIAHGSWRGTAGGIGRRMVRSMVETFGSLPKTLRAAISPSIGPCCYEIGREVITAFQHSDPDAWRRFFTRRNNGAVHFSLWEAIRNQLVACGIPAGHIETAGICTSCRTDLFYSYRRENGHTGRNGVVISFQGTG